MSRPHSRRHAPSLMAAIATLTLTTPVASVMAQEAPPATQPPAPAEAPTQTAEEAPTEAAPAPAEAAQEAEAAPRKEQPEPAPVQAASAEAAEQAPAAEEVSPIAYEPQPQASVQLEDGETQQLATVVISAQRPGEGALPDRPVDSVYGIEMAVVDTPRSVSEISEKQLRQDVVRSADDLVKYAPGVTRGGGQNVNVAPQIRGQNSELFQDGQRIFNVRHPTNFNAYEAADIVAGAPSVALGPVGSSGGYTNYVTKKPVFGKTETEVSLSQGAVSPEGSWNETRVNVDTNHGVGKTFAYRASVTINRADDFYYNVKNNWNAYYGAFAWRPFSKLRVDWNASYDDYYDFNITHGWNRVTQDLVDSYGKKYNAGRATPIISNPDGSLWSPVYASGARDSDIIGWQARENQNGKFVPVGPINNGPLPTATPETAGRVSGWVYDPSVPGNRVTSISPRRGQRAEDQNSATRIATQSNIHLRVTRNVELNNKFLASRSLDKNDSVGSFLGQNQNNIFDNRIELRNHAGYKPFGLDVTHDSNSGLALRHEEWESLAGNNSFNINPYDLTKNPKYKNPGDLLGIEYAGNSGSWVGTPGTPQLTSFGYLNLPAMYPVKGGLYAEKGGFPGSGGGAVYTSKGSMFTTTLFTQQNFMIEEVVGLNAGLRQSWINTEIATPFAPTPADKHKDENRFGNNSIQLSPLLKPTQNTTLYYTWDRSHALNTGGFFNVATWGAGNTVLKQAFTSVSKLHEVGLKADIVPNKVFASLAGYLSSRDTSPDINGNMARLETKGIEASLRLQPVRNLRTGVNLSYIHAEYSYIVPAGFSPYGFAPDNATVWGDRNALNKRTGTKYDAAGIPSYSGTGYIDYAFDFGLGSQLSAWVTSPWFVALSEDVKIPTQYNLDLSVYYRQPQWDVSVNVTNLTNANNFVNGLAGSTTEFVQPMRPFAAAARAAVRF